MNRVGWRIGNGCGTCFYVLLVVVVALAYFLELITGYTSYMDYTRPSPSNRDFVSKKTMERTGRCVKHMRLWLW
jgi:hypothetical protein